LNISTRFFKETFGTLFGKLERISK